MHRAYTREQFLRLVEKLRRMHGGIAITTDIIVGFPGETDDDFAATKSLAEEVSFDNAFVFRYSPRRDTPAAEMDGQLPEEIKEQRNQELLEVVNAHVARKLEACVGRRMEILCEGASRHNPDRLAGRTRTNKIVVFEGAPRHVGQVMDVRITRSSSSTLYGDPAIL